MASRLATPPSAGEIEAPSAPKHGFEDSWVPYNNTRKSSRVSSQRAQQGAQTPSPRSAPYNLRDRQVSPSLALQRSSPGFIRSIESPAITVAKKRAIRSSLTGDALRVSGALSEQSTMSAAATLGLSSAKGDSKAVSHPVKSSLRKGSMLPTPVKTPKKSPEKPSSKMASISRTLFNVRPQTIEDAFPTPKRGRGKYSDPLLDSDADGKDASIKIHEDSRERIPEVDLAAENELLMHSSSELPDPLKTDKIKVQIPGESEVTLEEAVKREDGLVYTFRGKHMFRKFTNANDDMDSDDGMLDESLSAELDATVPARFRGPLTRSSLKPRLLFPTDEQLAVREKQSKLVNDEEEAATDIEERTSDISTPSEEMDALIVTPTATSFAPVSPPTTGRATRSSTKADDFASAGSDMSFGGDGAGDERPVKSPRGGPRSPFDTWRRTKARYGSPSHGKKRHGDDIKRGGNEVSKRHRRGGRAQAT